jgi:signal transduction histidine kinase
VQALPAVAFGLVLLPLTVLAARPLASLFGWSAGMLVPAYPPPWRGLRAALSSRWLAIHAAVALALWILAAVLWALTSSYFWPEWLIVPSAALLAVHAWLFAFAKRSRLPRHWADSGAVAISGGIAAVHACFLVVVWAITPHPVFWPVWPIAGLAALVAAHAVLGVGGASALSARIAKLETTRAGAIDVQESELRRIERDLHDGAQARLVALGMSLGMAEQQLSEEPERARALLAEARAGAETALRELRDLARGIHPRCSPTGGHCAHVSMRAVVATKSLWSTPFCMQRAAQCSNALATATSGIRIGMRRPWTSHGSPRDLRRPIWMLGDSQALYATPPKPHHDKRAVRARRT